VIEGRFGYKRVRIVASLEAETFLWRRILQDERVYFNLSRARNRKRTHLKQFAAHEPFYATIFVKRLSAFTRRKPGNASTPTKTNLSVALLDSDCQSETIDYTDEGFICQVPGFEVDYS
jgi:hypothetical protein